jgi:hypothetical protein
MTNSEAGDALYNEILNSVTVEYGWVRDYTLLYVGIAILLVFGMVGLLFLRKKVK